MAIAIALSGFNDLGGSVTPLFGPFSFDGSFPLPICHLKRKNKENLLTKTNSVQQNAPSKSVFFSFSFICATVSNVS